MTHLVAFTKGALVGLYFVMLAWAVIVTCDTDADQLRDVLEPAAGAVIGYLPIPATPLPSGSAAAERVGETVVVSECAEDE